ncbi:hypothetical protein Cni_G16337 [Canna indica]|uniref:Uncharacterized protein n=1 Tax=Canna indica TaxID=4628 RepID=A0AAQ3KEZ4_9LILI|nr:hypothetical protein Cni_G16337 [Canna indica]
MHAILVEMKLLDRYMIFNVCDLSMHSPESTNKYFVVANLLHIKILTTPWRGDGNGGGGHASSVPINACHCNYFAFHGKFPESKLLQVRSKEYIQKIILCICSLDMINNYINDKKTSYSSATPSTGERKVSDGNTQTKAAPGFAATDQQSSKVEATTMLHDEQPQSSNGGHITKNRQSAIDAHEICSSRCVTTRKVWYVAFFFGYHQLAVDPRRDPSEADPRAASADGGQGRGGQDRLDRLDREALRERRLL